MSVSDVKVFIFGAGKVGRGLAKAYAKAGGVVTLRPARKGPPKKIDADLVILAVRDRELAILAEKMRDGRVVSSRAVCVHAAGALDAEVLAPLRAVCAGVAQMHPMISFASTTMFPSLTRGNVHVQGDAVAVRRARAFAKALGMTPRTYAKLDTIGYHAAAGLVANTAAALAAIGTELLVKSGVARTDAPRLLGPLLRSVAENVEALGFPDALTGPVRRGDAAAVTRHLSLLSARLPSAVRIYLASIEAQLPLARALAEAPPASFDAIAEVVRSARA